MTPPPVADPNVLAQWFHYEEIAMHFNSLLMQYRLQVIAGAGTLGTIAGYLIGEKVKDLQESSWLRALVSTGLFVLVLAAAMLDLGYYSNLLQGAVKALVDFEAQHREIRMSTAIDDAVREHHGTDMICWAYGLMLGVQLVFIGWSWTHYLRTYYLPVRRARARSAPTVALAVNNQQDHA